MKIDRMHCLNDSDSCWTGPFTGKVLTISVEITKTIDERKMQKTTKENQTKAETSKGSRSYGETVKFHCLRFH